MSPAGLAATLLRLVDIGLVAVLLYFVIVWLRSARSRLALLGLAIIAGVYLAARLAGLTLTAWVFQGFIVLAVIVIVFLFQEDIRRVFERIAVLGLRRGRRVPAKQTIETVVRSVFDLAHRRHGALLVVPGRESIERHVEGGVRLDGAISSELLESLFDPHTPTHDGAVILEGDRVLRFGAHLPLSQDFGQLSRRGTRHAAALGLAERTDALAIVVSEERGHVSVAHDGRLGEIYSRGLLTSILHRFGGHVSASDDPAARPKHLLRRHGREVLLALLASVILWALVVPGSETGLTTLRVPVRIRNVPPGYELVDYEPREVEVEVTGLRRDLVFLQPSRLRIDVDVFLVQLGRRTFDLPVPAIRNPASMTVAAVKPETVTVRVRPSP